MGQRAGICSISHLGVALMGSSILAGVPQIALAAAPAPKGKAAVAPAPQPATASAVPAPAVPAAVPAPAGQVITSITVDGVQRLEPDTVLSYVKMRVGQTYTQVAADQVLKDLNATELFSDLQVRNDNGHVTITVKENPVINRIVLEGNKHLKEDKINPEIKLAPRQIFTRSKVRADVARIIELYKRQGRFGASVEPKMVKLDQNRVDIIFEITEGPKSKVRQINVIGNEAFTDKEIAAVMMTKESRPLHIFRSGTSYDPDKLAYDQQKLRQFYLTNGYADFRVVSAVAELTPNKRDFIITYVIEEGKRYKFGDVKVDSQLRDFDGSVLAKALPEKKGNWYNAKQVEDTIDQLNDTAGAFGYIADVRPEYKRDPKTLTMGITFDMTEVPRVYVERIDVNGNTLTQDKVVRREFRLAEGDAFNTLQIKRSTNRIKSLGYFQDKFEVKQVNGSAPDRVVLEANVEEKPTGELQLSAGYSSLESFIFSAAIKQNNFRGRGQTVGLSGSISRFSKSIVLSFAEPYLLDKSISLGLDVYRRDYNNYNYYSSNSNTLYSNSTTGFQARLGFPLTEYSSLVTRYTLNYDSVSLDPATYYSINSAGKFACNPLLAGRYLCEAEGKRTSSIIGASLIYENLDNRVHPSKGRTASIGVDLSGLGGSVRYARLRANAARYWPAGKGFIFSVKGEGGVIRALGSSTTSSGADAIQLTDRFYLGEPQISGFDIRGVGPRIVRKTQTGTNADGTPSYSFDRNDWTEDALGGRYYYLARAELEIPLGAGAKEMGIRPSIFMTAGAVWGITHPATQFFTSNQFIATRNSSGQALYSQTNLDGSVTTTTNAINSQTNAANTALGNTVAPFQEFFYGDTPLPRISIGVGFNWNSPFGPFRIDIAKSLLHAVGDDTKIFTFNVGTQF
ncbi:MAG: outer membrane protein assembly factor BamA [Sphingomonadales bacterium]|nr:outer membrane protein assembly factor BamA [Sphingomonadales bacterium]MDE2169104.1 outer membrane protein assembly factor BamA [Sphingomonadales bacterium]